MYSIRLEGDVRKLVKRLNKIQDVDIEGISLSLAESLRTSTRNRFKETKSPEGKKWKRSIRADETGGTTLTDSAGLKNSIKSKADGTGFAIGTNKIYARTHQFGEKGRIIRAKTPKGLVFKVGGQWKRVKQVRITVQARPFLGINEEDMYEIKSSLEKALEE